MRVHPSPKRIRRMMRAIESTRNVARLGILPSKVIMNSLDDPLCGMPGCFAGEVRLGFLHLGLTPAYFQIVEYDNYSFSVWATAFACYVFKARSNEFCRKTTLSQWAADHPKLWGNEHGIDMFSQSRAYGPYQDLYAFRPEQLRDHWLAVADRIEKHERKQKRKQKRKKSKKSDRALEQVKAFHKQIEEWVNYTGGDR